MKKIISLLVLLVAVTSCEEDVKFNNPAVQGLKDDELWRATDFTATITANMDGTSLTIEGDNGFETVVLKTDDTDPGTYILGETDENVASYGFDIDGISDFFSTSTGVGGNGQITISDDPSETDLEKGIISGTFRFNAVNEEGEVVNFKDGVFYRVPITVQVP